MMTLDILHDRPGFALPLPSIMADTLRCTIVNDTQGIQLRKVKVIERS